MIDAILHLIGNVPIEYQWLAAACVIILFTFVVDIVFFLFTMVVDLIGGFFFDRRN